MAANPRRRCRGPGSNWRARLPLVALGIVAAAMLAGCATLFPVDAGEDLAQFDRQAPHVGQPAPALQARRLDGTAVQLADLIGTRPVVLQLGSHSCPVYRYRRFDIAKLQREYGERVAFVVVYTVEAHPAGSKSPYRDGESLTAINRVTGTRVRQPETMAARIAQATWSTAKLERRDVVVVDAIDDSTWRRYGSAPSAAFVIGIDGTIALRQPWVEPKGIARALDALLQTGDAGHRP